MATLWTRGQLKDNAKGKLRFFYWQAFLVCLIAALLGAGTESVFRARGKINRDNTGGGTQISINANPGADFTYNLEEQPKIRINTPIYQADLPVSGGSAAFFGIAAMGMGLLVLAMGICFSNIVQVGKKRYFVKKTDMDGEAGIGELFSCFGEGYVNQVLVMFRRGLSIFLWSLLLLIPGVIKSYEYYMVPYLLAEDPHLSWEEARDLSRKMMDGHKFDLFVLELSFLGWDIAGLLLCGVGQVFVYPYKEMVYAELYGLLRSPYRNKSEGEYAYEI